MRRRATLAILLGAIAARAIAAPPAPCGYHGEQLFVSPMGEPFRAPDGASPPVAAWFAGADADHDGRLTLPELAADADRFFTLLDLDGNGEIAPAELANYENKVAPEIRLYQSRGFPGGGDPAGTKREQRERRQNSKGGDDYGGELGAGRFAWLNIPEPVAAADLDMNRGVSRAEFRTAAANRFRLIDKAGAGVLTLATLPPLPPRGTPCPPPARRR